MLVKRLLSYGLKIGTVLILLEPIWMLLPFAGFLYGSVLNLDFLQGSYYTAWLLYFILPVQTLLPLGLGLMAIGVAIFLVGAFQIYRAKIVKSGLVQTGIYKKFRHPQYTGLTLLCIGFLMIWGRFVTYILFFMMMFLYYLLAQKEERECEKIFGADYEKYKQNTWFLFPGEKMFQGLGQAVRALIPDKTIRIASAFILLMGLGISACFGILAIRESNMSSIPIHENEIVMENSQTVKTAFLKAHGGRGYSSRVKGANISDQHSLSLDRLYASDKLKKVLAEIDVNDGDTLLGFVLSRTVRQKKPYYNEGRVDLFYLLLDNPGETDREEFWDSQKKWKVKEALEIQEINLFKLYQSGGEDPIQGDIKIVKAQSGESQDAFSRRMKMIFNIYRSGYKERVMPFNKMIEG